MLVLNQPGKNFVCVKYRGEVIARFRAYVEREHSGIKLAFYIPDDVEIVRENVKKTERRRGT